MKRLNKMMFAVAAAFVFTALLPAGYAFSAEKMSAEDLELRKKEIPLKIWERNNYLSIISRP